MAGAFFILTSTCFAEEGGFSGSVQIGGGVFDEDNSAKFQEYRDLDNHLQVELEADYLKNTYYNDFLGKNIGRDDQSYTLQGGRYNIFKYRLLYDETPHNYTFDARSPYTGVGTNNLTYTGAAVQADDTLWPKFDYAIIRNKYGGEIRFSLADSYYFKIGLEGLESEGVRPLILSNGMTERAELPEPVDQRTGQFALTMGYAGKKYLFEISGLLSSFENTNKYMNWLDPNDNTATFVTGLAPDNDYKKYGFKFTCRDLPLTSFLALNASHGKTENSFSITDLNLAADARNAPMLAALNRLTFDGEKAHSDFTAALSSRPLPALDTRLSYRYSDTRNDSSIISYLAETNADRLFDYSSKSIGIEADYKLPKKTKLTAGYDLTEIDRRNRPEFAENTDHTYAIGLKNNLFEYFNTRISYRHTDRESDAEAGTNVVVSDFTANDKNLDQVRIGVEIYPGDTFDVGLDFTLTNNEYDLPRLADDTVRGRSRDDATSLYADMLWRLPDAFTLNGFAGFENRKVESLHNDGGASPYMQDTESEVWIWGVSGNRPFMNKKLNVSLSWEYQDSDGESDFGIDPTLEDIDKVFDYTKQLLEAKAEYAYSEKLSLLFGFLYEHFTFSDLQYDFYLYNTGIQSTYLSGAYAHQSYETALGYVMIQHEF